MKHQISNIFAASNKSLLVFTESDAITNLSYAKMTLETGILRESKYLELKQLAHQLQPRFSKVFLFAPHEKFKDDNIRTMAVSYEFRKRHFETLLELYDEIDQKYEILSGTYLQNFEAIKNSL